MLTAGQRQTMTETQEAILMALSLGGKDFTDIFVAVVKESSMTDAEVENLGNLIGRIPSERIRT